MRSFENLIVWKKAVNIATDIYKLTSTFPKNETYALVDQLHRASVAIPSNIAEGAQRQSDKEFIQFLYISYGSCAEVRTQLLIAHNLHYLDQRSLDKACESVKEIERMLNVLIRKIQS